MSGKVVGWAMEQRTGSAAAKLVLVKLADNANEEGYCWPSVSLIVEHTELSERTVRDHLRKLEIDGLISIEARVTDRGQISNAYQLNVPYSGTRPRAHPPAAGAGGGVRELHPPPAAGAGDGVREVQGQYKNRQIEPSLNLPPCDAPPVTGRVARLVGEIGRANFGAWFSDAQILDGNPARIIVSSKFRAKSIESKFAKILRRVFGEDVVVEVAIAGDGAATYAEPQTAIPEATDTPYWVRP